MDLSRPCFGKYINPITIKGGRLCPPLFGRNLRFPLIGIELNIVSVKSKGCKIFNVPKCSASPGHNYTLFKEKPRNECTQQKNMINTFMTFDFYIR